MYKSLTPPQSSAELDVAMGVRRKHSRKDSITVNIDGAQAALTVKHEFNRVKAVILVGGPVQGTAFRPLSLECPMPLIPIANQPAVMHLINKAKVVTGMMEIILIGGYNESEFSSFVRHAERETGIPVRYLQEYTNLGTAGGLYHFRDLIARGNPDAFFVLHGNVCCDIQLEELLDFHACVGEGNHCSMVSIKAREDQACQYGCAVADPKTFAVMHYVEKPSSFVSADINTGIYVMTSAVFDALKEIVLAKYEVDGSIQERVTFELDLVPQLVNAERMYLYKSTAFWSQVKTAGSAVYANRHYLGELRKTNDERLAKDQENGPTIVGDVIVHPSARIDPSAKLGPNVSIGSNVKIQAGARVKDAIILDNVELAVGERWERDADLGLLQCLTQEQSGVYNSVVGWNCSLGQWARVEGLPVNVDPNDPSTHIGQKPIFNSQGKLEPSITVLGDSVHVADEVMLLHCLVLPHKVLAKDRANEIIL
eukprot:TRINITY_DN8729_c0_g1_i9.p1 TRINITY_DN8729_c0_g1~~TRINITY_DN8729_c0_g1_i9.p1  ORF type:complete len:503 (+),score=117.20 TRINITY_DN8729_c0_g1_i9:65-1510(+)